MAKIKKNKYTVEIGKVSFGPEFLGTLVFPREIEHDIEQRVHFCKVLVLFGLGAVSG